jgi:hypothetical protein
MCCLFYFKFVLFVIIYGCKKNIIKRDVCVFVFFLCMLWNYKTKKIKKMNLMS